MTPSGANAILAIVDSAPVFAAEDLAAEAAAIAEAVRRFGLAELKAALAVVRAAEGAARSPALTAAAERLGALAAAGTLEEALAKSVLKDAAGHCGLTRDDGARAVIAAIAAGIKRGKKTPADLAEVRGAALAALRAPHKQSRPREAADRMSSPPADGVAFPGDADPPESLASSPSSFAASPAPPIEGGESTQSSQTGALASMAASAGGQGGDGDPPDGNAEDDEDRDMRLAFYPLTDLGNAERFRDRWRGRLLFNTALATTSPGRQRGWLAWDDKRWRAESGAERVMIAEHETVRLIQREAKAVRASGLKDIPDAPRSARDYIVDVRKGQTYSDKIANWGRASESVQKLGALSKRGGPYLAIGIGQLDTDRMKINVNNGTLTVRRRDDGDYVQFGPHDPADRITKLAPVDYDPAAVAPEFEKFLARIQPDAAMRLFLQQWFGLSLTGDTSPHKLVFLYGKGRNGKSVLVNLMSHIAGDYAQSVKIETFLDQGQTRSGDRATPDLAKLPGVRLLRTSEPEKNARLAEALIKLVTGGEPMDARHLQGDFFTFFPEFKLTIQGNYKPVLSGTDEGIKSRLLMVPFKVFIPPEERDKHLADRLIRTEASGILNWMLDGLRSWLDNGLSEPEEVTSTTAKFFATSDVLGRFLEHCTVREPGQRVQSSVLHQVYDAWCKSSGETPWKNKGFSSAMDERGYERIQSNVMWWLDIKLIKSVNDFVDHEGNPIRVRDDQRDEKAVGDIEF